MKNNKPDYYNDIDKVYEKIWDLLYKGLKNRDSPFHIPVFICGNEKKFGGRIVVLRGISEKESKLWFHSDIRSNKVNILKSNSEATLLFYDKNEKIQLRISGNTKINYKNDITSKSWEKTAHMSRQCYLGDRAPGSNALTPSLRAFSISMVPQRRSSVAPRGRSTIGTCFSSVERVSPVSS